MRGETWMRSESSSRSRTTVPPAVLAAALLVACAPLRPHRTERALDRTASNDPVEAAAAAQPSATDAPLGESVGGRPLYCSVYGSGDRTVLLLGAIHGDEPGSHELVRDFERWIASRPGELANLRLVVASPCNPDGLLAGTRHNANGIDLNRNFPSRNFRPSRRRGSKPLSEPESRFVQELLARFPPVLVISVHQPRRSVNYDGPARALAEAMARHNGYRVEASVGYPTPGSLGSWVGIDHRVPIITLELPRQPSRGKSFFDENLQALRSALESARTGPVKASATAWK